MNSRSSEYIKPYARSEPMGWVTIEVPGQQPVRGLFIPEHTIQHVQYQKHEPIFSRFVTLGGPNQVTLSSFPNAPETLWVTIRRGSQKLSIGLEPKRARLLATYIYQWLRTLPEEVTRSTQKDKSSLLTLEVDEPAQNSDKGAKRDPLYITDGNNNYIERKEGDNDNSSL